MGSEDVLLLVVGVWFVIVRKDVVVFVKVKVELSVVCCKSGLNIVVVDINVVIGSGMYFVGIVEWFVMMWEVLKEVWDLMLCMNLVVLFIKLEIMELDLEVVIKGECEFVFVGIG